jgi:soluble lytic murein transglycosylase-like protein
MKLGALNPATPSSTVQGSTLHHDSSFWSQLISQVAEQAEFDPRIAVTVAAQESGLNPRALNTTSGAVGIMQLLPATAAELGVNPHDVVENILGGVQYLRQQFAKFGDTAKALAAYNWGPHHVAQAIERWGESWLQHAPTETQQYVNSILSAAGNPSPVVQASPPAAPAVASVVPSPARTNSSPAVELLTQGKLRLLQSVLDAYLLSGILS